MGLTSTVSAMEHKLKIAEEQVYSFNDAARQMQISDTEATPVLAIQIEVSKSETISTYVASVNLIDLSHFYQRIIYEKISSADKFQLSYPGIKYVKEKPIWNIDKKYNVPQLL